MELISSTEYIIKKSKLLDGDFDYGYIQFSDEVINHANFLKTPLSLGQFLPTDLEGNVLEEPEPFDKGKDIVEAAVNYNEHKEYKEAQERVIFEGFDYGDVKVPIGTRMRHDCVYHEDKEFYITFSHGKLNTWNMQQGISHGQFKTIGGMIKFGLKIKPEQAKRIGI